METDRKFKSWMDRRKRTEKGDIRWPKTVSEKVRDRDKRGKARKLGEEEKEEKLSWADLLSPKFFSARPPECSVNNWVVSYDSHLTSGSSIVRSSDVVGKKRGRREEREHERKWVVWAIGHFGQLVLEWWNGKRHRGTREKRLTTANAIYDENV